MRKLNLPRQLRQLTISSLCVALCASLALPILPAAAAIQHPISEQQVRALSHLLDQISEQADRQASESAFGQSLEDSLEKRFTEMNGRALSPEENARLTNEWVEALRRNAFAQGSAFPNQPYFANHPLDSFSLLGQTVDLLADSRPRFKYVNREKLTLEVIDQEGKVVRYLNPTGEDLEFLYGEKGSVAKGRHFFPSQIESEDSKQKLYTFRLSYQGHPLHIFKNNIQSAVFFDRYLVFLEPVRIIQGHRIVNLSYIDLDYFQSALSRTSLPIFRMPIELDSASMADTSKLKLEYSESGVRIGDKLLGTALFQFYAQLEAMAFNVTSSLVDSQFYQEMGPVVNEVFTIMNQSLERVPEETRAQMERAGVTDKILKSFLSTMKSEVLLKHRMGPAKPVATEPEPQWVGPFGENEQAASQLANEAITKLDRQILENLHREEVWDRTKVKDPIQLSEEEKVQFRDQAARALKNEIPKEVKEHIGLAKELAGNLMAEKSFQEMLNSYNTTIEQQRKLTTRLGILWARMTLPQPLGAPKIKRALAFVASSLGARNKWNSSTEQNDQKLKEAIREFFGTRSVEAATLVAVGGMYGMLNPEQAGQFYLAALDVGRQVMDGLIGWGSEMMFHSWETMKASFAWLSPTKIYETFLTPDKLPKLGIGVASIAGALLFTAGTIHTIVNTVHYAKSMSDGRWQDYRRKGMSWFKTLRTTFVEHISGEKKKYYETLGHAEASRQGTETQESLSEEKRAEVNQQVESILKELNEIEKESEGLLSYFKSWPIVRQFFDRKPKDVETFGEAIRHFLVGFSSWTHSTKVFGKIWNPWFLSRNFWLSPRSWLTMLSFPNYFNRAVKGAPGGHFATVWNGGKRPIYETLGFFHLGGVENADQLMKELTTWERSIIPAEQLLHRESMKQAYLKFVEMASQEPELIDFIKGGPMPKVTKQNFYRLQRLDRKFRIYFQAYFTETFKLSMQKFMKDRLGIDPDAESDERSLKAAAMGSDMDVSLNEQDAIQIVAAVTQSQEPARYAEKTAFDFVAGFWQRVKLKHFEKVDRSMNPAYKLALNRYLLAERKMEDPEAMARATRQMMIGMITDKPMELVFTFLFAAGIDQGILKPLQDNMFDENSWFHLSRYVFWNGYFTGIMMGLLAEVWMKIQMDARLDDMQEMNHVPEKEDVKRGYFSWLRKSMARKTNSIWENYKWGLQLTFANMQAYLLMAIATNLLFLGRFDLDNFVVTYLAALIPFAALHMKIDQGFEVSGKFDLGHFPKEAWSHPAVQEYRAKKMGSRRVWINLFNNLWTNVIGNIEGNWLLMTTSASSPRTLTRLIFGGYLPSELVVNNVLRPVGDLVGGPIEKITRACEAFLTNNHTDAIKIKPRKEP